jgi:phage FluMu gp28-like protein
MSALLPTQILSGSGATRLNLKFLAGLERALPERELVPVLAWVGSFYGFQQNWLLDPARFSLLVKSRQIGASHTYAAAAVLWALFGEDTSIISVGEREASEVLSKVALHAEALRRLGSEWAKVVGKSATRISLATGASIFALPSTSGGRGQSGNALLDEAAYYQHPEEVWDGASATIMHGYRMRVSSTPNGVGNMFHKLVKGHAENGYRLHSVTIEQAIADGMRVSMDECWKMARGDPRLFDQLFRGIFLDAQAQYISSELIARCSHDRDIPPTGNCYAGLDIGKKNDLTVMIVVKKIGEQCFVVHIETRKRTDSQGLAEMVDANMNRYNVQRLAVDETGLGAFPAEAMQKYYGAHRVEPVSFTNKSKEALATGMYAAFANTGIILPKTEREGCSSEEVVKIREDIASIRRIVTEAGNVRYDAPHTDEGHADRAWALALALHAAGSGYAPPDWDFLDAVGKQWPKPLEL